MNLTNEQIQAILDGAPKGVRGYNIEESHEGYSYYFVSILDLDLLREILTLRQEVEHLKAQQSEVSAQAVEDEWIECTKRLPESGGWYMVAIYDPFDLGYITEFGLMAHFSGGKSETWSECDPIDDGCEVTHWMPLIKGPYANQLRKGEGDE